MWNSMTRASWCGPGGDSRQVGPSARAFPQRLSPQDAEARITKCAPVSQIASSPSWEGNPGPQDDHPGPGGQELVGEVLPAVELPPAATATSVRVHMSVSDTNVRVGPLPWGAECTEFCEASAGPRSSRSGCVFGGGPQAVPQPAAPAAARLGGTGPDSARLVLPAAAAAGERGAADGQQKAGGFGWPPARSGAGAWRRAGRPDHRGQHMRDRLRPT